MAKRSKRKRASREHVRDNAKKGASGGNSWFDLPEEVGKWVPEKAGRYDVNILPYEVKTKDHPDDVEKGVLWYKLPFKVHHNVGTAKESVVCPSSVGGKCPICDERERLRQEDSDKYEEILKKAPLSTQNFVAYNVLDPDDDDKVCMLVISRGKFAVKLEEELKDPDNDEHLSFFDVNEDGRTLRVRFSEETFQGRKYLEATRIDFKKRDEMDEDETLDKVVCLEEALTILPFDKLKSMLFVDDMDDDDDDDEPDDSGEKECVACEGSGKSSKGRKCKPCQGTGLFIEKEDDDDDEEEEKPKSKSKSKKKKKPEPEPEDEDEDEDDDDEPEDEEEEKPKSKSKKKKKPEPKEDEDDDDDDDDDDDEEEEKPKSKSKKKKSDKPECPVKGGTFGKDLDEYDECEDCPLWDKCEELAD